jgi:hypothetical protein
MMDKQNSDKGLDEKVKIIVMVILVGICCVLTYYFHVVLKKGVVFTHFFYFPIILSAVWWKRKGMLIAMLLAVMLICSHVLPSTLNTNMDDYIRAFIFILVSVFSVILTEKRTKRHKSNQQFNKSDRYHQRKVEEDKANE